MHFGVSSLLIPNRGGPSHGAAPGPREEGPSIEAGPRTSLTIPFPTHVGDGALEGHGVHPGPLAGPTAAHPAVLAPPRSTRGRGVLGAGSSATVADCPSSKTPLSSAGDLIRSQTGASLLVTEGCARIIY